MLVYALVYIAGTVLLVPGTILTADSGFLSSINQVDDLKMALGLSKLVMKHFWDDQVGGFFFTADNAEHVLIRQKEILGGSTPSGNSVAMLNLLRLGLMTGNSDFQKKAARIIRAFSAQVARSPSNFAELMATLDFALGPTYEVVIAGKPEASDTQAMLKALRTQFIPDKIVLLRPSDESSPAISHVAEFTKYQLSIHGKATAYVCLNFHCKLPTTDPNQMLESLNAGRQARSPTG